MAEKIVSPGVFTKEVDQTFLPAAVADIGCAIVGPTAKGPALVPTIVESYAQYEEIFGSTFRSGSRWYRYLTDHAAEEYLRSANVATVVRILDGEGNHQFSHASAEVKAGEESTAVGSASGSITVVEVSENRELIGGELTLFKSSGGAATGSEVQFRFVESASTFTNQATEIYVDSGSSLAVTAVNLSNAIGLTSVHGLAISASSAGGATITLQATESGSVGNISGSVGTTPIGFSGSLQMVNQQGGADSSAGGGTSFKLHTLSDGWILNSSGSDANNIGSNQILSSGSRDNLRWEISSKNTKKGTFSLLIRRGDDTIKRKQILETWNNVSLDPDSKNYISKLIGDQKLTVIGTESDPILQLSGSNVNKSRYVRVEVLTDTPFYLNANGDLTNPAASASLPATGSGSHGGAFEGGRDGVVGYNGFGQYSPETTATASTAATHEFYSEIGNNNVQGYVLSGTTGTADGTQAYNKALNLLANADEYDFNLLLLPGVTQQQNSAIVTKALDVCENRGDCFVIVDPVIYGQTSLTTVTTEAEELDSNYGAMYWPWVQIPDTKTGNSVWVPPGTIMGGVYAFNDKVAHPWFAPAGLNRGGLDRVIQAERKLSHSNRDDLYESNVNPIATFPGQGVCAWGQKTLQKSASALDRVNVRRLMIRVKKFIASSSRFLVFEQNNNQTRTKFLNIVNPYLEQVQANSGLNAFRVVMDDTNNTPDVVDRNILYGQIFVQPTRTAEFIVLDFTIQPTGATFPE